jgi:hypothetical protein
MEIRLARRNLTLLTVGGQESYHLNSLRGFLFKSPTRPGLSVV